MTGLAAKNTSINATYLLIGLLQEPDGRNYYIELVSHLAVRNRKQIKRSGR